MIVRELIRRNITAVIQLQAGFLPRAGVVWADGQGLMSSEDYLTHLRKVLASDGLEHQLTEELEAEITAAVNLGSDKNLVFPRFISRLVLSPDGSVLSGVFDRPDSIGNTANKTKPMCSVMRLQRVR